MLRKLVVVGSVLACLALGTAQNAAADTFALNVDFCTNPCLGLGGSGQVVLTQVDSDSVRFDVTLTDPLHFHQTNGLDAFMFNYDGSATLTYQTVTPNYAMTGPGGFHEDGAGTFDFIVQYAFQPAVDGQTLSFIVNGSAALTLANFETLGGVHGASSVVDFAANVSNGVCTGLIGGGNGTAQTTPSTRGGGDACSPGSGSSNPGSTVPEPASLLLLGAGLAFAGARFRRKHA